MRILKCTGYLFIGITLVASNYSRAEVIAKDDFESGSINRTKWDIHKIVDKDNINSLNPLNWPLLFHSDQLKFPRNSGRCGKYAAEVTLRPKDRRDRDCKKKKNKSQCDFRAELQNSAPTRAKWGDTNWYGFSLKLRGDVGANSSLRTIIGQWKAPSDDNPSISQRYDNGVFHITVEEAGNRRTIACAIGDPHKLQDIQDAIARVEPGNSRARAEIETFIELAPNYRLMQQHGAGVVPNLTLDNLEPGIRVKSLAKVELSEYLDELICVQGEAGTLPDQPSRLKIEYGSNPILPDPAKGWVDMQFGIRGGRTDNNIPPQQEGSVEIWANNKHIVTVRGEIGDQLLSDPTGAKHTRFKFGVYRTVHPTDTLTVYFDEYKLGTSRQDVLPSCR